MSTPLKQRLHIILLGVEDVARSAAFYDGLGWTRAPSSHVGFVVHDLGGFAIALISRTDFAADALSPTSEGRGFSGVGLIYYAETADDVACTLERAVEAGGTLVKPATVTPYGVAGYFSDPDGHLFEVDFEAKFRFDEDDHLIVEQQLSLQPNQILMDGIAVAPSMCGKGAGPRLLSELAVFAAGAGYDTIRLDVLLDGQLTTEFRDGAVSLAAGEMFVMPKGVEDKANAGK